MRGSAMTSQALGKNTAKRREPRWHGKGVGEKIEQQHARGCREYPCG
jgi:hypothetical protein